MKTRNALRKRPRNGNNSCGTDRLDTGTYAETNVSITNRIKFNFDRFYYMKFTIECADQAIHGEGRMP